MSSDEIAQPAVLLRHEPDEVEVTIDPAPIEWPAEGVLRAGEDSNRSFADFGGAQWRDVDEILEVEGEALRECVEGDPDPDTFWERAGDHADDLYESHGLVLDFGVAGAVFALNAARCPTRMSCNGHGREPAYVDFWTRPERAPLLADAAKAAGVGLCNCVGGGMVVYSDLAEGLHRFAVEIRRRSALFRKVRSPRRARVGRPSGTRSERAAVRQLQLPLALEQGPRTA